MLAVIDLYETYYSNDNCSSLFKLGSGMFFVLFEILFLYVMYDQVIWFVILCVVGSSGNLNDSVVKSPALPPPPNHSH